MPLQTVLGNDNLSDGKDKINANDSYLESLITGFLTSQAFVAQTSVTVNHGFSTKNLRVLVLEGDSVVVWPDTITFDDDDNITVTFSEAVTGTIYIGR